MSGPKVRFIVQLAEGASPESFVVQVHPEWAKRGAERFVKLVESGYFTECRVHRVVEGFMAQFGLAADPKVYALWGNTAILDDSVKQSNTRGRLSFAMRGLDTRTCQVFISYGDNSVLDSDGFAPFAEVVENMEVADKFYSGYGDAPPGGGGPQPERIKKLGNAALEDFPKLSYIIQAEIMSE
ncbi:unnamed protein product [Polarella glacialis]|uniref:Peptidyl-prolyl cis-trans isomerase n=1 Tax=Polarella glacialis TaxID=89957 RepID=A0A813IT52_POLGL|nr:unnamed protein product [Polarella glacialis]